MTTSSTTPATSTGLPPLTLADLAVDWAQSLRRTRAPSTVATYTAAVADFIAWHEQAAPPGQQATAASLHRATAQLYLDDARDAGAATSTLRLRHTSLRLFAAWMVKEHVPDAALLLGLEVPKQAGPARLVTALEAAEIDALLAACKPPPRPTRWQLFAALRDTALIMLLLDTGCRAEEMCSLATSDIDSSRRILQLTKTKGGRARVVGFSNATAEAVSRYLRRARRSHALAASSDRLWLGTNNRSFGYEGLRGVLETRAAAAGVTGLHAHRFRHTAASRLLDRGMNESDVLALFGWRSRSMLDRYVADTAQRRAVENVNLMFDERDRGR